MNIKMKETYDSSVNDFIYNKDEVVSVTDLEGFPKSYAVYRKLPNENGNTLDWIPRNMVEPV